MSKICCNFAPANVTTSIRGPHRNQALAVSHGESGAPEHFNKPRVYSGFGPCVRVVNARNFAPDFETDVFMSELSPILKALREQKEMK